MTILNVDTSTPSIILSIAIAIVLSAAVGIIGAWVSDNQSKPFAAFVAIMVLAVFVLLGILNYPKKCHPRIEATISDEINFNDIYDRYEIVSKRGEIYTLIEKERDEK